MHGISVRLVWGVGIEGVREELGQAMREEDADAEKPCADSGRG